MANPSPSTCSSLSTPTRTVTSSAEIFPSLYLIHNQPQKEKWPSNPKSLGQPAYKLQVIANEQMYLQPAYMQTES